MKKRRTKRREALRLIAEAEKAQGTRERVGKAYAADTLAIEINDVAIMNRVDRVLDFTGVYDARA